LLPDVKVAGDSGLIVTASRDGFVYVFQEKDGQPLWRFSIGEPIVESPAVIEERVYVTAQLGGMSCLETKTGKNLWFAPGLIQFVAASKARVYATDRLGRIVVLDASSGASLGAINTESIPIKLMNTENDRLYLADGSGLVQCLREVEQTEPLVHGKERKLAAEAAEKRGIEQKAIGETEKMPKKEHVAPAERPVAKERPAPKERPVAKERPAPKERLKKASKKKAAEAAGGDDMGAPGDKGDDMFGPGGGKAGKAGKTPKGKKPKKGAAEPF
jgi:hypothetical protein